MIDDPYLIAYVMHAMANVWGICHSVSVEQPEPVERCVVVPLFGEADGT